MQNLGIYLHIPFCRGKCPYCDFYSRPSETTLMDRYTEVLQTQIRQWGQQLARGADTLYLGGGTPSRLGGERIARLVRCVKESFGSDMKEITVECNPSDREAGFFQRLREAGVNRISLGMQSAVDEERKALGRRASAEDVMQMVREAKGEGISNISLDLMLGIPQQTSTSLERSLQFCIQSGVTHLSAYLLKIEDGTYFSQIEDKLSLPDEDEVCRFYLQTVHRLEQAGFRQYEISNFALPGFESQHNLKYWNCEEYLGLGPSAHSFLSGSRFYYEGDLEGYLAHPHPIQDGGGGDFVEYMMMRLRLREGVRNELVAERYGSILPTSVYRSAEKYREKGLLIADQTGIRLTPEGFLLSNQIIGDLCFS